MRLTYYSCRQRPVTGKGTPGESIPVRDLCAWSEEINKMLIKSRKKEITEEHIREMRFMPEHLQKAFPLPRFYNAL